MRITPLHEGFIMPTKATIYSAAMDLYMSEAGTVYGHSKLFGLGFAAAVPIGYGALLIPRSGVGAKHGLELNNTVGLIDSDYRGEWKAALRTKSGLGFSWEKGDRVLQALILPIAAFQLELVGSIDELGTTHRGEGGFGSSGSN